MLKEKYGYDIITSSLLVAPADSNHKRQVFLDDMPSVIKSGFKVNKQFPKNYFLP